MERLESEAKTVTTSDTSQPQKSKATPKGLQAITPADKLNMLQALLNELNKIEGVSVWIITLYRDGERRAGLVISGCHWEEGKLVLNEEKLK